MTRADLSNWGTLFLILNVIGWTVSGLCTKAARSPGMLGWYLVFSGLSIAACGIVIIVFTRQWQRPSLMCTTMAVAAGLGYGIALACFIRNQQDVQLSSLTVIVTALSAFMTAVIDMLLRYGSLTMDEAVRTLVACGLLVGILFVLQYRKAETKDAAAKQAEHNEIMALSD